MGNNKRKGNQAPGGNKKAKTDIHKVGKYLPGGFPIDPKMKGVMVTCARGKEVAAGKEACDLLSEYAAKMYGTDFLNETEQDEDESVEDAIAREIAQLKKPKGGKKFLPLMTGTDCVIFIRAMEIEPSKLVHYVLTDLQKSANKRTRYCQRFIPVDETSYANMDDIKTMTTRVLAPYFHAENQEPTTFKVLPKIRHNDKVDREELVRYLAHAAGDGESHTVNLTEPKFVILAEVIKSICFMGVVSDYESLKKYNIQSIFEAAQKGKDEPEEAEEVKKEVTKKEEASVDTKTAEAATIAVKEEEEETKKE